MAEFSSRTARLTTCFRPRLALAALVMLFLAWGTGQAFAASARRFLVEPPHLSVQDGALYVDCSVGVNDEESLRNLLKDGAVLELRISFEVDRRRSWWSNAGVNSGVFVSGLRHDPLTREFLLSLPGDGRDTVLKDRNLTRLLHVAWRNIHILLASDALLREQGPSRDYLIFLDFELRHTELPPWLENTPGFWSSDVVPREQRELEYRR